MADVDRSNDLRQRGTHARDQFDSSKEQAKDTLKAKAKEFQPQAEQLLRKGNKRSERQREREQDRQKARDKGKRRNGNMLRHTATSIVSFHILPHHPYSICIHLLALLSYYR